MADEVAPWATITDLPLPDGVSIGDGPDQIPEAIANDCLQAASTILYRLSGGKWPGVQADSIRPAVGGCSCGSGRTRSRSIRWVSEFALPCTPVLTVSAVYLDGELLDEARYRLDDNRFLVFVPESETAELRGWPCCQDMLADPLTDDDTWQVDYTWGGLPDTGGVMAAARLALELAYARVPGLFGKCRLPQRVQSVSRQGVTYAMLDDLRLFAEGRTGLMEVDLWLGSLTIGVKRRRSAFIDPHAIAMRGRRVRRTDWNPSS